MSRRAEQAAQRLLDEIGLTAPSVDVEDIARHCGAVVTRERFRRELSGMLVRGDDGDPAGTVIGVNSTHHPRRQRFTIAHEIGHLKLHKGKVTVDSGLRVDFRDASSPSMQDERDANAFAAALLMPAELVSEAAEPHVRAGATRAVLIGELARTFEVSEEAMGYRLLNLGFLSY